MFPKAVSGIKWERGGYLRYTDENSPGSLPLPRETISAIFTLGRFDFPLWVTLTSTPLTLPSPLWKLRLGLALPRGPHPVKEKKRTRNSVQMYWHLLKHD